jgi:hypothetical protein
VGAGDMDQAALADTMKEEYGSTLACIDLMNSYLYSTDSVLKTARRALGDAACASWAERAPCVHACV